MHFWRESFHFKYRLHNRIYSFRSNLLVCFCLGERAAVINSPLLISFKKSNKASRSTEVLLHLCIPVPRKGQSPYESWPRALSIWMLRVTGLSSSRTWPVCSALCQQPLLTYITECFLCLGVWQFCFRLNFCFGKCISYRLLSLICLCLPCVAALSLL